MSTLSEQSCLCCGGKLRRNQLWCMQCKAHVILRYGLAMEERTYFAQHGKDCPFQAKKVQA